MPTVEDLRATVTTLRTAEGARKRLIKELHAQGVSFPELARSAGLSVGTVHRLASERPNTLVTIGYEGRDLQEVAERLRRLCVDLVMDVRLTPISRRIGFSKKALGAGLKAAGIDYRHDPRLGNAKDNRAGFVADPSSPSAQRYLSHLHNGSSSAVGELLGLLEERRIAILCFEHDPAVCHRRCLADEVTARAPATAVLDA